MIPSKAEKPSDLPVGIQDFEKLILDDLVYVDKTRDIYQFAATQTPYFLSRPRRFGKSLLISTLDALFKGKKTLFKGLWIENSDWEWKEHPVIRIDMSKVDLETPEALELGLLNYLKKIAGKYNVDVEGTSAKNFLDNLIDALSKIGPVVVLIDEYDKPIISNLFPSELAQKIRDALRPFYAILKAQDKNLRFVFLTGVTKFSQMSVFSELNNLDDLSMQDNYSTLLGYTREEIEQYFGEHMRKLAEKQGMTTADAYAELQRFYNGYNFSKDAKAAVFNPFSVLRALKEGEFEGFWFATGTPKFLYDTIKHHHYDFRDLDAVTISASRFTSFSIESLDVVPLLYQAGYLTLKDYDKKFAEYTLGYPNAEVANAFADGLINYFSKFNAGIDEDIRMLSRNLDASPWDHEAFFKITHRMLVALPYDMHLEYEAFYGAMIFMMIRHAGQRARAEIHTHRGRVDLLLELHDKIILFEFKLDKTAQEGMDQIKAKKYYESYINKGMPVYLVAMNFSTETREMDDALVEVIEA